MNKDTKTFARLLEVMDFELRTTQSVIDVEHRDYDYLICCYYESMNNEQFTEPPSPEQIAEFKADYESLEDFVKEFPLILVNRSEGNCAMLGKFDATDIVETFEDRVFDCTVDFLLSEAGSYGVEKPDISFEPYWDITRAGDNYKAGTENERDFYKTYESTFDQVLLIKNGCQNVNINEIAETNDSIALKLQKAGQTKFDRVD